VIAVMERLLGATPRPRGDRLQHASTLGDFRPCAKRFVTPFVGVVPPIKPAAALTRTRLVSLLATPAPWRGPIPTTSSGVSPRTAP
jgi:glutamate racemase